MKAAAWLLIALGAVARADTTWLPGPSRAIPRSDSASRDTAVFEYAYGPRAQLSLGVDLGLTETRKRRTTWRVGVYALVALENGAGERPFPPNETWRLLLGASLSVDLTRAWRRPWLPRGAVLEASLVLGYENAHESAFTTVILPASRPGDIPFGGGGEFLAPELALHLPLGGQAWMNARLYDRIYMNEWPLIFGDHVTSDVIADALHEGLTNLVGADVVFGWRLRDWAEPQLALVAERLFPHDAFADDGYFLRAQLGVVLPGRAACFEPFVSVDAGNGQGVLINRRELRLSGGVRLALF